jgi:tellurite resistance protein
MSRLDITNRAHGRHESGRPQPAEPCVIGRVPAAFFSIVLGVAGLGGAWRLAAALWDSPPLIGEAILLFAAVIWAVLVVLYAAKWLFATPQALAEFNDPIQCCFIGLAPVSTLLIAIAVAPYHRPLALILFGVGAAGQVVFATCRTGRLWQGARDPVTTTPILYLPTVAGCFVTATASSALGLTGWAAPFFGAGLFSWLAIESVLMNRLYTGAPLQVPLRPTIGIQLAPPTVGAVALLSVPDAPPLVAEMLLGYGVVQVLILFRLMPWIGAGRFAASYWAFSFGLDALAAGMMRLQQMGTQGLLAQAALPAFVLANAVVLLLAVGSIWLLIRGRLLPPTLAPVADLSGEVRPAKVRPDIS